MVPVSSRTPQRRRRSRTAAAATGVLFLALAGCAGEPAPEPSTVEPTAESTPLADYDTADLTLVPGDFCALVDEDATAEALGGEATAEKAWQPGTRLPGSKDVSNEFGCSWTAGTVTASAWVFAASITAQRAGDVVTEAVGGRCERLATAPSLGETSVAQRCRGAGLTGIAGLIGDAWVGCEISGLHKPDVDEIAVVGEWCVGVIEALREA